MSLCRYFVYKYTLGYFRVRLVNPRAGIAKQLYELRCINETWIYCNTTFACDLKK